MCDEQALVPILLHVNTIVTVDLAMLMGSVVTADGHRAGSILRLVVVTSQEDQSWDNLKLNQGCSLAVEGWEVRLTQTSSSLLAGMVSSHRVPC